MTAISRCNATRNLLVQRLNPKKQIPRKTQNDKFWSDGQ